MQNFFYAFPDKGLRASLLHRFPFFSQKTCNIAPIVEAGINQAGREMKKQATAN
jgi:hypothetical protein